MAVAATRRKARLRSVLEAMDTLCFINLPLPGPSCGAAPRPRRHTSVEKELQDPRVQGWRPPAGIVVFAPSATHTQITTAETPKYLLERECGQGLEDRGPSS